MRVSKYAWMAIAVKHDPAEQLGFVIGLGLGCVLCLGDCALAWPDPIANAYRIARALEEPPGIEPVFLSSLERARRLDGAKASASRRC